MGEVGEAVAAAHLVALGYRIIARDWRCRIGQIDIAALDGKTLVVVEVKARSGTGFGLPQEGVDARKRAKLRALAEVFAQQCGVPHTALRIDVVAVLLDGQHDVRSIDHIVDAVGG